MFCGVCNFLQNNDLTSYTSLVVDTNWKKLYHHQANASKETINSSKASRIQPNIFVLLIKYAIKYLSALKGLQFCSCSALHRCGLSFQGADHLLF